MKTFKVTIQADRYPMTYTVEGSSWSVAVARAIRQWQRRFKGSRTTTLSIRAIKGVQVREDSDA